MSAKNHDTICMACVWNVFHFIMLEIAKVIELFWNALKGSRRPSIASIHSAGSMRSFSARRYEKEREQKEERESQRRLSKMNSMSVGRIAPTPSPHSTDDLLPTLEEDKQVNFYVFF